MFWVALYLFHPGARRVMRWMMIAFLAFSMWAFIGYSRAHAQIPVTDGVLSTITQTLGIQEITNQIKSVTLELQQLQTATQSYMQWVYIGQQLIHDPSLGTFTQLANRLGLDTSLPLNPAAVQGLIAGAGGINGLNGIMGKIPLLGGLVNTSYANNQLYRCQTGDAGCQLSQVSSASRAASQGLANKMLADISSHMANLQSLRDRAATASDPKTVQDLTLQANIEQSWLQGAQGQLQAIGIMHSSQEAAFGQAATQKFDLDADGFIKAAKAVQ